MKKRGQIQSHALAYVLLMVIVAIVFVMGYRFITKSSKLMDQAELIQFKNKLSSDIQLISNDYQTFKKVTYALPRNLDEVCFLDETRKQDLLSSNFIDLYPLIKDSITSNSNNVFFMGEADHQAFLIPNIQINHYPFMSCFHRNNGETIIGMEGLGGDSSLILADFLAKAKVNTNEKVVLKSSDHVITLEIPKGTIVNFDEISIEMVEPVSFNNDVASDVYKFEPAGTTFNPPISLGIKYNPKAAGDCPEKLIFSQFDEHGGNKVSVESKSIDCDNKIAYFEIDRFV